VTRSITQVDPKMAARLRKLIASGQGLPKVLPVSVADARKKMTKKERSYAERPKIAACARRIEGGYELDVGVAWDRRMYNTSRMHKGIKEAFAKAHRTAVWNACLAYLSAWTDDAAIRGSIERIEFIRICQEECDADDNLPASFKYVVDALAQWVLHGRKASVHGIGHADGFLKKRGVTWTYHQQQSDISRKLHGARIRLWLSEANS
jgi:hypothetical protein